MTRKEQVTWVKRLEGERFSFSLPLYRNVACSPGTPGASVSLLDSPRPQLSGKIPIYKLADLCSVLAAPKQNEVSSHRLWS